MLQKLKEATFSVLPVVAIVLLIHFTMYKFAFATLITFAIGLALLLLGQVVFLTGLDISVVPMGEYVGNSVTDKKQFYIFIIFGFVFGVVSTIAEPDFQVLATKIVVAGVSIPKWAILLSAGVGVGAMLAVGLVRIINGFSLNILISVMYIIVAILSIFLSEKNFSVSLDAGAGTVGVITSPFLLALGIGVAKIVSHSRNTNSGADNFGLIALASCGALLMMCVMFLLFDGGASSSIVPSEETSIWLTTLFDCLLSLVPLVVVFFVFEAIYIKISWQEKRKLLFGSFVTFVGFYLFLFGIEFGFSNMGYEVGVALASVNKELISVVICTALSFFIVFCEPAIKNLATQIEDVTNRNIRAGLVVGAIAVAIVLAVIISVLRIYLNISIWWIFGLGYGLIFLLMPFVPKLFSAIAFDSGGVASGTLTIAFIYPIMMALAGGSGGFGTIGIIVMTPILVIEILGFVYKMLVNAEVKRSQRMLLRLSRTEDEFSNIERLRIKHEREYGGRSF